MHFTITGYSTALFSTWYHIEELDLLFDAGDGVCAGLLQKSRGVKNVFISHADRDHLTGLLQFNQLNSRPGYPVIHYPKDAGSFPALQEFSCRFDTQVNQSVWQPIVNGSQTPIHKDFFVKAMRNNHVLVKGDVNKSFGFKVVHTKQKLKPEYAGLAGPVIAQITAEKGKAAVSETVQTPVIGYSADTPAEDFEKWSGCKVLIHEATFINRDDARKTDAVNHRHSILEDVIRQAADIEIEHLVLGHFSTRYDAAFIDRSIREGCEKFNLKIPVYRVLPGEIGRDILKQQPVNG